MKQRLAENLKRVQGRIEQACARAKRDPGSVTLIAVTKYAGMEHIQALIELGHRDLGESRVQDLTHRAALLSEWRGQRPRGDESDPAKSAPRWHLVGHLQRNKVKAVLPCVHLIHSVDSLRLAEEIDLHAEKIGNVIPVLVEVNAGGEASKHGVAVAAVTHFVEQIGTLKNLSVRGMMAMAPLTDDQGVIRHTFGRVRELFEEVVIARVGGPEFRELSLGMSNDFELGIQAGATMVRIGSALFEGIELSPQPAALE